MFKCVNISHSLSRETGFGPLSRTLCELSSRKTNIRLCRAVRIDKMARPVRKIIQTAYYYGSESESESEPSPPTEISLSDGSDDEWSGSDSDSDATTVILGDDWDIEEVSDSEDGTDYESETESESDSEELDDPKPYYGEGFRVYFDSHTDKKFFMKAFGFQDA